MPCPLELSAYMEASFHCLPSNFFFLSNSIPVNLQSFADAVCSGKMSCQFHVTELVRKNFNPCPLELSSYLEASYICIPSRQHFDSCSVNLQSFADGKCSGKTQCEFFVTELVRHPTIRPCPLELASYLETAYICIPGIGLESTYKIFSLCFFQSFADNVCSGKTSCQFHIAEILMQNIKPCPPELSSYMEASFICLPSNHNY